MAKKSFFQKYTLRLLGFVVLIVFGAWMGIARFATPASVNQLTIAQQQQISPKMDCSDGICRPTPPGCYYKQVQCVKAPCDPILVCASPTPQASCTPRPSCLDSNPACKIALMPEQEWCPRSSTRPTPSTSPSCREGIASLKLSTRCGATGFTTYEFRCESGKSAQITSQTCLEAETIFTTVRTTCINVCIGDK